MTKTRLLDGVGSGRKKQIYVCVKCNVDIQPNGLALFYLKWIRSPIYNMWFEFQFHAYTNIATLQMSSTCLLINKKGNNPLKSTRQCSRHEIHISLHQQRQQHCHCPNNLTAFSTLRLFDFKCHLIRWFDQLSSRTLYTTISHNFIDNERTLLSQRIK